MKSHPDRENTLSLLGDWAKHHAAVEKLMDGIKDTMGIDIDGPLFEIVWTLFNAYTDTLSVEVGDFGGWLEWHASENNMGAKKMQAGYDGQLIAIESLDDLCRLIEISRERGAD